MHFELQPTLEDRWIGLRPLRADDFEPLYAVASDPLIWEQHPSRTRYQREVFENYFRGAIESGGALLILDAGSGRPVGCSRYYDLDEAQSVVAIGYTFLARSHWGSAPGGRNYNRALKTLMLDHAFRFVDAVLFHVGAANLRSRRAMEKLGGQLIGEAAIAYYGEAANQNVIYRIQRGEWERLREAS